MTGKVQSCTATLTGISGDDNASKEVLLERADKINLILERWLFLTESLKIPINHLASTKTVVRYKPTNEFNWFANHRNNLDSPGWGKLGGEGWLKVRQWNGCGMVLPIPGGGLGDPHCGLLQIPFPYAPYKNIMVNFCP